MANILQRLMDCPLFTWEKTTAQVLDLRFIFPVKMDLSMKTRSSWSIRGAPTLFIMFQVESVQTKDGLFQRCLATKLLANSSKW